MRPHHREEMPDHFRRTDGAPHEHDAGSAPLLDPGVSAPAVPATTPTADNDSVA